MGSKHQSGPIQTTFLSTKIAKKVKILDFLNFGQRCLGWFWLIEKLFVLAQIDVWLVGGKCVKGSCPRSTLINNRQAQSQPNINLGQYKQLFYQPKPSQTPLTEVQKIQYFDFF